MSNVGWKPNSNVKADRAADQPVSCGASSSPPLQHATPSLSLGMGARAVAALTALSTWGHGRCLASPFTAACTRRCSQPQHTPTALRWAARQRVQHVWAAARREGKRGGSGGSDATDAGKRTARAVRATPIRVLCVAKSGTFAIAS